MGTALAYEVFEEMKEDISNGDYGVYLDTWNYEDEYSHNDIEEARDKFIELANVYFASNSLPYYAREVCENVYLFDKNTNERLYK